MEISQRRFVWEFVYKSPIKSPPGIPSRESYTSVLKKSLGGISGKQNPRGTSGEFCKRNSKKNSKTDLLEKSPVQNSGKIPKRNCGEVTPGEILNRKPWRYLQKFQEGIHEEIPNRISKGILQEHLGNLQKEVLKAFPKKIPGEIFQ